MHLVSALHLILCIFDHMAWLNMCHTSVRPSSVRTCQPCLTYDYCIRRWIAQSSANYYDILGLKPTASQSQIKSAYYRLSKIYHPDTAKDLPSAKEKFAKLSTAYEVLGNPHKRALYDRKHDPGASFRPVSDDDIEYRDFLRRRGTFSSMRSAYTTSARRSGREFDEFYKQQYGNTLKYNWEAKKNSDYHQQRMKQTQAPQGSDSTVYGLVLTACLLVMCFIFK